MVDQSRLCPGSIFINNIKKRERHTHTERERERERERRGREREKAQERERERDTHTHIQRERERERFHRLFHERHKIFCSQYTSMLAASFKVIVYIKLPV